MVLSLSVMHAPPSAWPWHHTLLDAPSLNLPSRMRTLCQPLSLSLSDDISPPHLSPSCNLTLSDARATLCACKLSACCTVSFFLTSLCYKLTTPSPSWIRAHEPRFVVASSPLTLSDVRTTHPRSRVDNASSLTQLIINTHTRTHAQWHNTRRHRLDARGHHTCTQADDTTSPAPVTDLLRLCIAFARSKPSIRSRADRQTTPRTHTQASEHMQTTTCAPSQQTAPRVHTQQTTTRRLYSSQALHTHTHRQTTPRRLHPSQALRMHRQRTLYRPLPSQAPPTPRRPTPVPIPSPPYAHTPS
jgi:hypothetical protein